MPVVREYFIKFYGEEHRDIIEKRFDNCTYIGYVFPEDMKKFLNQLYQDKLLELYSSFLKNNNIELSDNNIKKYFGYKDELLRYPDKCKLSSLFEYIYNGLDDVYNRNNLLQLLREISGNKTIVFGSKDFYKVIEEIKGLKSSFDELVLEFKEYKLRYSKYDKYVDMCEDLEKKLRIDYYLIYLKEIYEYLSEHDKEIIDKVFDNEEELNPKLLDCYELLCGDDYSKVTLVDSFSGESEEKINNPDTPKYILNSIYSDRVKYFKKLSVHLGRNYNSYINSNKCLELIPDSKIVDRIIGLRSYLSNLERKEYLTATSLYKEHLNEIKELNLFGMRDEYDDFISGVSYIEPNLKFSNGSFSLYNLLVINSNLPDDYFDNSFVHECNHLNETELVCEKEGYCIIRSGFEIWLVITDKDKYDKSRVEANFDLDVDFSDFDEIINELIAQDITKLLHDDDIYLFDDKEISKVGNGSIYERFKMLVEDFYNEFREEIKYSRVTGDMKFLYNLVGKDNFLELNSLINEFGLYFDDIRYYDMLDDWYDDYETDDTIYFDECLERAKVIFEKMKNVASLYVSANSSLGM